jgi:hypothetical protein
MGDQTFKNYLHDLGTLIKEHAREALEGRKTPPYGVRGLT